MILEQFFSEFYLGYRMEIDMGGQIYYAVFDLYDPNEFKTPCYTKSDIAHMVTGSQRFNDYLLRPLSEEWRYAGAERPENVLEWLRQNEVIYSRRNEIMPPETRKKYRDLLEALINPEENLF